MARVAPATLAATFTTFVPGAASYPALAQAGPDPIAPDWRLGLGSLIDDCLGARLQPHLPETALRLLLGTLAAMYAAQNQY